ncbi:Aste57867_23436 [Aphanomyces stellatus]|uniref:Aste57867_23436 protein n=1 Tax=Aphanomyces stellatus TaxID=120398 RepID=A0A485LMQ8_9STRA|nr:hypothetical protein As57867_023365 [Aphanomyces stellatus]VFU00082.1 Aste57867_23436 [Aphanomyces stellatus]
MDHHPASSQQQQQQQPSSPFQLHIQLPDSYLMQQAAQQARHQQQQQHFVAHQALHHHRPQSTMYYGGTPLGTPTTPDSVHEFFSGDESPSESRKSREMAPFLRNLRNMLDRESPEVLRWNKDGTAFEIHDMDEMMNTVLPKYFKHKKYTSFQRQLNYFNFKKWTKSRANVCTFSNELFTRHEPYRSTLITRKKSISGAKDGYNDAGDDGDVTDGCDTPRHRRPRCDSTSSSVYSCDSPRRLDNTPSPPLGAPRGTLDLSFQSMSLHKGMSPYENKHLTRVMGLTRKHPQVMPRKQHAELHLMDEMDLFVDNHHPVDNTRDSMSSITSTTSVASEWDDGGDINWVDMFPYNDAQFYTDAHVDMPTSNADLSPLRGPFTSVNFCI